MPENSSEGRNTPHYVLHTAIYGDGKERRGKETTQLDEGLVMQEHKQTTRLIHKPKAITTFTSMD
eukprot:m.9498 g.9498  ORF g.9498 m.9498 type:complete len:65 (+) comp6363_c0_seq4:282-476(+)